MNISDISNKNLTKEDWFRIYGSTMVLDSLTFYVIGSFSVAGIFLNWFSFFIFTKKSFDSTPLFKYFKVYVINSSMTCLITSTNFISGTYYLFNFTNTYWAKSYACHQFPYVLSTTYFNSAYLDIYLSLERLSNFIPRLNAKIKRIPYKKACILLFIISLLVNLPQYFVQETSFIDVKLNNSVEFYRIYIIDVSSFGKSLIGRVVSIIIWFLRDIFTLFMEIGINIFTIVLLKKNLNKKKFLIEIKRPSLNSNKNKVSSNESHNESLKKNSPITKEQKIKIKEDYLSKFNRNLTYSVLTICFFSILTHLFTF